MGNKKPEKENKMMETTMGDVNDEETESVLL
jgi:hypothetical protein